VIRRIVLPLTLALLASLPATAQTVVEQLRDLRLEAAVALALVADADTRPLDVAVTARAGRISLAGEVPFAVRSRVVSVARAVTGVALVEGLGATAGELPERAPVVVQPAPERPAPSRPTSPRAAETGGPVYHTVQAGDTLFGLARRYETTPEAIQRLNNTTSTTVQLGRRLRVR
jgi:LysM repeat protein